MKYKMQLLKIKFVLFSAYNTILFKVTLPKMWNFPFKSSFL
jgi:hypothetical protein